MIRSLSKHNYHYFINRTTFAFHSDIHVRSYWYALDCYASFTNQIESPWGGVHHPWQIFNWTSCFQLRHPPSFLSVVLLWTPPQHRHNFCVAQWRQLRPSSINVSAASMPHQCDVCLTKVDVLPALCQHPLSVYSTGRLRVSKDVRETSRRCCVNAGETLTLQKHNHNRHWRWVNVVLTQLPKIDTSLFGWVDNVNSF